MVAHAATWTVWLAKAVRSGEVYASWWAPRSSKPTRPSTSVWRVRVPSPSAVLDAPALIIHPLGDSGRVEVFEKRHRDAARRLPGLPGCARGKRLRQRAHPLGSLFDRARRQVDTGRDPQQASVADHGRQHLLGQPRLLKLGDLRCTERIRFEALQQLLHLQLD